MFRSLLIFALLISTAHAVSDLYVLHECPVCGEKSVIRSHISGARFGKRSQDVYNHLDFLFAGEQVCHHDLYASWFESWKEVKPGDKAKLVNFLKDPALLLSNEEKSIISGHEIEFRNSNWLHPLWVRTCNSYRTMTDQEMLKQHLRIYFVGRYVGTSPPKKFEKRLYALYCENAITALKSSLAADWPTSQEKRAFACLLAELTLQAGRDAEAHAMFQKVIAAESDQKPDWDTSWILRCATEQSFLCGPEAKDPEKLLSAIMPELLVPSGKTYSDDDLRWIRHQAAVGMLVNEALSGSKTYSDVLWKLLDRKTERLLALLETKYIEDITPLLDVDARWRAWFVEIGVLLNKDPLLISYTNGPYTTHIRNLLVRAAIGEQSSVIWRKKVLLPAVRKSLSTGGIPDVNFPAHIIHGSSYMPSLERKETFKPTLNQLSREVYELWRETPEAERGDIARMYIRILQMLGEDKKSFEYPSMYFLPNISETEEGRAAIRKELDGLWKSTFWKVACAYAADIENSRDAFLQHPITSGHDNDVVVELLQQKSDPFWKDEAMKQLSMNQHFPLGSIEYLIRLDLPETRKALDDCAKEMRHDVGNINDIRLSNLDSMDKARVDERLKKLPIR